MLQKSQNCEYEEFRDMDEDSEFEEESDDED